MSLLRLLQGLVAAHDLHAYFLWCLTLQSQDKASNLGRLMGHCCGEVNHCLPHSLPQY